ncbi:hypothetical protein SNEBB_008223 [Seison nebaliae]|nr:hypothetical protein SNEBB_008223 [Seison nebaliae]
MISDPNQPDVPMAHPDAPIIPNQNEMPPIPVNTIPVPPMAPPTMVTVPNHTIYINNLNEKIKKNDLKKNILAFRTLKMRGQAFVIFDDISSASDALKCMQSFPFYDKPMRIQFAKTNSHIIAQKKGTSNIEMNKRIMTGKKPKHVPQYRELAEGNTLFLKNLIEGTTKDKIHELFSRFVGYKDVRIVPDQSTIAFVEFDSEANAAVAKRDMSDYQLDETNKLQIAFAE